MLKKYENYWIGLHSLQLYPYEKIAEQSQIEPLESVRIMHIDNLGDIFSDGGSGQDFLIKIENNRTLHVFEFDNQLIIIDEIEKKDIEWYKGN